ncbi:MAG TPA: RodZ domain-containing protein [bacterium]|jgi:transcriptional regulator with XRE-family HTH domain
MKIGELLKQARLEKGWTLDEVARDLYIHKKYLEALEAGDFDTIPGEAYQRAYFRKYAEHLGIAEYIDNLTKPVGQMDKNNSGPDETILGGMWDGPRIARVGIKIALIILIPVFIVLGVKAKNNPKSDEPEPARVSSTDPVQIVEHNQERSWDFPSEVNNENPINILDDDMHEIRLTAHGQCWVKLVTPEEVLIPGEFLVLGDSRTYNDVIGFRLTAGAPEKLDVEFDGELVPWPSGVMKMVLPEGTFIDEEPGDPELPPVDIEEPVEDPADN